MDEVGYTLSYAKGMQLVWASRCANGEVMKALAPGKRNASLRRINELIG